MAPEIACVRVPTSQEWDDAWYRCPYATFFHSREWAEIWAAGGNGRFVPAPLAIELTDGTRIVLPFSTERFLRGLARRHVSSPAGTYGGWLADAPLDAARQAAVLEVVRTSYPDLVWRANPFEPLVAELVSGRVTSDETHILDLSPGFESIVRTWRKGSSSAARQARQAGVSVSIATTPDDWKSYYGVYEDSLRRWGARASSRYSWPLFQAMVDRTSPNIRLWLARFEGTVIAGALCCYSPRHAVYWHGAALASQFRLRPVNLLMEVAIRDAADRGVNWFDFNPSGGHQGVKDFKRGFGTKAMPCDIIEVASMKTRLLTAAGRLRQMVLQ